MRALPLLAALTPLVFAAATLAAAPQDETAPSKAPESAAATQSVSAAASDAVSMNKAMLSDTPAVAVRVVWVVTSSRTYHCPADLWFGRTHDGQYMSEDDARAQGFRPEKGKACNAPI